jgi:hypothetical protein
MCYRAAATSGSTDRKCVKQSKAHCHEVHIHIEVHLPMTKGSMQCSMQPARVLLYVAAMPVASLSVAERIIVAVS